MVEDEQTEEQKKAAEEEVAKKDDEEAAAKEKENDAGEETNEEEDDSSSSTPKKKSLVKEAADIVVEMKEQNKIMSENLKRAEKLQAEELLGGNIPAGKEKTEEDKLNEEAERLSGGLLNLESEKKDGK